MWLRVLDWGALRKTDPSKALMIMEDPVSSEPVIQRHGDDHKVI